MGNSIKEKLENELPYKPYFAKIIWCPIVFLCLLAAFIAYLVVSTKDKTDIISIVILTTFFLLTICSFIFYSITLIKDGCGIRFAKLNELARISEKIDINTKNKKTASMNYIKNT